MDRKIDDTAILFLLVENRQQTHDWTLVRSGANGPDIQESFLKSSSLEIKSYAPLKENGFWKTCEDLNLRYYKKEKWY